MHSDGTDGKAYHPSEIARFSVYRLQRPVRVGRHRPEIRQIGRDRGAEVQPYGGRCSAVQSPVEQERRQTLPVHPGPQTTLHQLHNSRSQDRREYCLSVSGKSG